MKNNKVIYPGKLAQIFALTLLIMAVSTTNAYAGGWGNFFNDLMSDISNTIGSVLGAAAGALDAFLGTIGGVLNALGLGPLWNVLMNWAFGTGTCGQTTTTTGQGIGTVICNVLWSTNMLPGLITAIAYVMGLMCAVTALVKLKDHVLNPHQTPLSDSMKRFVAGGAFFSLPIVTQAAQNLISGYGTAGQLTAYGITRFRAETSGGYGLDTMLVALVADILQPMMNLFGAFGYLAGLVLIMVGISRLLKTAQDGPRGPASLGTIMTFVTAGILFSLDGLMGSFGTSLFGTPTITTYPILDQSTGNIDADQHIGAVITSVVAFVFIIGWISFIRGFFIIREVTEGGGGGKASLMAGMTHIFGGAIAVNLGPMMNAVQATFGLDGFGVTFGM